MARTYRSQVQCGDDYTTKPQGNNVSMLPNVQVKLKHTALEMTRVTKRSQFHHITNDDDDDDASVKRQQENDSLWQ